MPILKNVKNTQINASTFMDVGRDTHIYYGLKQDALSILNNHAAPGALHDSSERFDPPKCHPRTRVAVLNEIRSWYTNEGGLSPPIMWLYGPAGAGKSAIAQTIAEECHKLDTLGACFFFSRMAQGRNNATRLIPTITYQIIHSFPGTESYIQRVLEKDPMIFSKSLETQLHQLVIQPLLNAVDLSVGKRGSKLIILDGLDECHGGAMQQSIIDHFTIAITRHTLPLCILISSRPEQAIRDSFSHPDRNWDYVSLVLGGDYKPNDDIKLFLRESFADIRWTHVLRSHIPNTWPSDDDIDILVLKSSGQFIFASTVIRYVESPRHRPTNRLHEILMAGNHKDASPFTELDALYMHILQSTNKDQHSTLLRIFGLILCTDDIRRIRHPFAIDDFLGLEPGSTNLVLADCHSVINVPEYWPNYRMNPSVYFLHASMFDFLVDPARSRNFFVDQGKAHAELFRACLRGVSSYHWTIRLYSLTSLVKHRENARIDKSLIEASLSFNLSDLFKDVFRGAINPLSPWYQYDVCLKQISWITKQVHHGSFDISDRWLYCHLTTLDDYVRKQLQAFVWPSRVAEICALVNKIQPITRLQLNHDPVAPLTWVYAGLLLDLDVVDAYKTIPSMHNFMSCASFTYANTLGVEQLFLDFLHHQERAGKYHISPQVYAQIALRCIDYIYTRSANPHSPSARRSKSISQDDHIAARRIGLSALPSILAAAAPLEELNNCLLSGLGTAWSDICVARIEYLKKYNIWRGTPSLACENVECNGLETHVGKLKAV